MPNRSTDALPRDPLSRLLLATLPPRGLREELEGDLAEELALEGHGRGWLWGQLLRSAPRLLAHQALRDPRSRERRTQALVVLVSGAALTLLGGIHAVGPSALALVAAGIAWMALIQLASRAALHALGLIVGSLVLAIAFLRIDAIGDASGLDVDRASFMIYAIWSVPAFLPAPGPGSKGCSPRQARAS